MRSHVRSCSLTEAWGQRRPFRSDPPRHGGFLLLSRILRAMTRGVPGGDHMGDAPNSETHTT